MKRLLKYAAVFLIVLLFAPVVAFFAYDLIVFQPKRSEIAALLVQADPQDRNPPPLIRRYLEVAAEPTTLMVARHLGDRFGITEGRETRRPLPDLLMIALVRLHLSEDEILGLFASMSYTGNGQYSLNGLAQRLFGKPLDALTEPEAAAVVAVLRAPLRYLHDTQQLELRRDALMSTANRH